MKILHLASEYPPQKVFGLGRFVHDLAVEQARQGHEVHVVTNSIGGRDHEIIDKGVHVHRVDFPPPPKPPDNGTMVTQFNIQLVERVFKDKICPDADLVNAHDWLTALASKIVARRIGAQFAVTVHDLIVGKRFRNLDNDAKYVGNIEHWMCREADRVICVSEHIREEAIREYGAPPEKTFAIHNAVSEETFPEPDFKLLTYFRAAFAQNHEPIILYVGRLDAEKGVDVLIKAFANVSQKIPQAKLVIAGRGGLSDKLRQDAIELGIERRVVFAGYAAGEVLNYVYRTAQIHVVPSLYEPFGIVALEGMLCGRPVIASATGGLTEIIEHGKNGMLVKPGDIDSLSSAIEQLLLNDPLREQLGHAGRQSCIDKFNWPNVAKKCDAIYSATLNPSPSKGEVARSLCEAGDGAPRLQPIIMLVVQTHAADFHLLDDNYEQYKAFAEAGHLVRFLCYKGESEKLPKNWDGIAKVIEVDAPKGHQHLLKKVSAGYQLALQEKFDWLIKIDSDVLIINDIAAYIRNNCKCDALGAPSYFKPVLDAIRQAGPPVTPSDVLDKIGGKYLRGFFFAVRPAALAKALPLMSVLAPRMKVEDATTTACLLATGAQISFRNDLPHYKSLDSAAEINSETPVIHFEERSSEKRKAFLAKLRVEKIVESSCQTQTPTLSVTIHVRNRKQMLMLMLKTLRQEWPQGEAELIIVDYGGSDSLSKDLRELMFPGLRYFHVPSYGQFCSSHARNIAIRAARGRFLLLLDSDLLVPPGFVARIIQQLKENPERAIYGPVYKLLPAEQAKLFNGEYDPIRDFETLKKIALPNRLDAPAGPIIAAPKENIFAICGFDEEYKGYGFQDIDTIERLKKSGLPQSFPSDIYALHQFHGYPAQYNTSAIELKNRKRFISEQAILTRNQGKEWGIIPGKNINLQAADWLEPDENLRAPAATPVVSEVDQDIIIWCEGARVKDVDHVLSYLASHHLYSIHVRWLNVIDSLKVKIQWRVKEKFPWHRFENHSLAQVITQLPRADILILAPNSTSQKKLNEIAKNIGTEIVDLNTASPESILVGMDEGIGNMIMLTPTLKALHSLYPEATIDVIGNQPALQVLQGLSGIRRLIDKNEKPDDFYDLLLMSGWRKSLDARLQGVKFAQPPVINPSIRLDSHEIEQHMSLVRDLGYKGATPEPYCSAGDYKISHSKKCIALADTSNPRSEWDSKRWPHYAELAEQLIKAGYDIHLLGAESDAKRGAKYPEGVNDLRDKLSLLETSAVLKQMDVVVANDSGLAHMSAALGMPTIVLFGPTTIEKSGPRGKNVKIMRSPACSPCQGTARMAACKRNICLEKISPKEVIAEIKMILAKEINLPTATIRYADRTYEMAGVSEKDIMMRRFRESHQFYERDLLEAIKALNLDGCYIDVGANIGNHTVFFANHCPCSRIIAFEPNDQIAKALAENVSRNIAKPVTVVTAAVMDKPGFVELSEVDPANVGSTRVQRTAADGVPAMSLDAYFESADNSDISFIKIDVEGAEHLVLAGATKLIASRRPVIAVELATSEQYKRVQQILVEQNYICTGKFAITPTYIWQPKERCQG